MGGLSEVHEDVVFTIEEVARHNSPEDCWIAVNGKVYDITRYTEIHPGGVQILREVAGTNATTAFHDVGHSDEAHDTLQTFLVGNLEQTEEVRVIPVYESKALPPPPLNNQGKVQMVVAITKSLLYKVLMVVLLFVAAKVCFPDAIHLSKLVDAIKGMSSFWKGVAISSTASGACFWVIGAEVSKSLDYADELRKYPPVKPTQKALTGPVSPSSLLPSVRDPRVFQKMTLTEKIPLTPNAYRFVFNTVNSEIKSLFHLPAGLHVQVRADTENGLVTRSYTPTHIDRDTGRMELTVKVYAGSKMGTYLEKLPIGGSVEVRGPTGNFKTYHRFLCTDLGMIAGGSGITPMWQIIQAICADPNDVTRVTLMYASRSKQDILLENEIRELAAANPRQLKVYFFVTGKEHPDWAGQHGRITATRMASLLPPVRKTTKYLVCGPEPMTTQVSKDLINMGTDAPQVFKHATDQVFVF